MAQFLMAEGIERPAPGERGTSLDIRRLGLWMFLATVTMLFAAFTSAYVVRKSGSDWHRSALPAMLWWNTGVLALSSVALEAGWRQGSRRRWGAAQAWFLVSLSLGVGFIAGQVMAWRSLMASGVYLPSNPFASFFYMMTGAHAVHVIAALAVLGWGTWITVSPAGRRDPRRWSANVELCRTFWHYLDAVWLYLFLLISVY